MEERNWDKINKKTEYKILEDNNNIINKREEIGENHKRILLD